jgi:hypothetical protein
MQSARRNTASSAQAAGALQRKVVATAAKTRLTNNHCTKSTRRSRAATGSLMQRRTQSLLILLIRLSPPRRHRLLNKLVAKQHTLQKMKNPELPENCKIPEHKEQQRNPNKCKMNARLETGDVPHSTFIKHLNVRPKRKKFCTPNSGTKNPNNTANSESS